MSRQNPTNPDVSRYALSPQHETTVDLLAAGSNLTEAAEKVGVTRQTVSEWVNRNPAFQAALNRRRQELGRSERQAPRFIAGRVIAASAGSRGR